MRQGEGIGQVLAALALQDPEQQGRQIRAHARGRAGRSQQLPQTTAHLAAGDLAAQQGVAVIEQLVADGRQEMPYWPQQVGDAIEKTLGGKSATSRFGPAFRRQVAHDRDRIAEGGQGALVRRPGAVRAVRSDPIRTACRAPAGPAVQAAELVAGGIDVQGIAWGRGAAHAGPDGPLQCSASSAARKRSHSAGGREGDALAVQGFHSADLLALEVAVLQRLAGPRPGWTQHDQA